ncbi:hypothetical protein [Sphingosinithalassobacter portus]|uniref:hypothetical protein n=1 Tax=Stakelama portus TaxID=2676234 RepID=UPI000D6E94DF|nr:hypothetical protein [Sphingosinithalassobacter portus]
MTNIKKGLLTAATSLALVVGPTVAQATSASALSLTSGRATTSVGKANKVAPAVIISVLAVATVVAGAVIVETQDNTPDSP